MLNLRLPTPAFLIAAIAVAAPGQAQDLAPHRAVYSVITLVHGKPSGEAPGTYAYELKLTCDGYVVNQRLRTRSRRPARHGRQRAAVADDGEP